MMAMFLGDCPRCNSKRVTFDARSIADLSSYNIGVSELFCVCRICRKSTVFVCKVRDFRISDLIKSDNFLHSINTQSVNDFLETMDIVSQKDNSIQDMPTYLAENVEKVFREGAVCLNTGCFNASATMFRLCIDLVTLPLLPDDTANIAEKPNSRQRRDLGLRLRWLFDHGHLPSDLKGLADCIREDANDAAHRGNLEKVDAEDIRDFTVLLLERLFTEPGRLKLAEERRAARRTGRGEIT